MEELNKLFVEINILKEKHKKEDLFNGFMSFGIGADETKHSRFIGMLLNPKGSHKQGYNFLKLFKEQIVELEKFELRNSLVDCEKMTYENRRIDIGIENDNQMLIIENKFKAQDQPRQLIDYHIYGKTKKNGEKNVFMIYLTRYGSQPTKESLGELDNKNVICISYEKHILQWLEACIDSFNTSDNIQLKISLEMYVELIRNVINRDKYMIEIMNNLKSNSKNMEIALDLIKAFEGKNFLDDEEFRKRFINQIKIAAGNYFSYFDPELTDDFKNSWLELVIADSNDIEKGSICFTGSSIYAKRKDVEEQPFEISCDKLNDLNLINLLKNNSEGINEWMNKILTHLEIIDLNE